MGNRRTSTIARLAAALLLMTLVAAACDWPGYRYGPALTGSNDTERTLTPANVATVVQRYSVPIGPSGRVGAPVVAGATRVLFWGALAMAATAAIGKLFHVAV